MPPLLVVSKHANGMNKTSRLYLQRVRVLRTRARGREAFSGNSCPDTDDQLLCLRGTRSAFDRACVARRACEGREQNAGGMVGGCALVALSRAGAARTPAPCTAALIERAPRTETQHQHQDGQRGAHEHTLNSCATVVTTMRLYTCVHVTL